MSEPGEITPMSDTPTTSSSTIASTSASSTTASSSTMSSNELTTSARMSIDLADETKSNATPAGVASSTVSVGRDDAKNDTEMAPARLEPSPLPVAAAAGPTVASSSSSSSSAPASASSSSSNLPLLEPALLKSMDDLLYGPLSNCNEMDRNRWREQGFVFSTLPRTLFGLTQTAGGPCGVLAPVQAFIMQRLLFGGVVAATMNGMVPVSPTVKEQDEALVWALTNILIRCVPIDPKTKAPSTTFTLISGTSHSELHMHRMTGPDAVRAFLTAHLPQLHGPLGVLTFVYSVLLTRGLEIVRSDMDDPSSYLVGAFGHSSQELVNLMLVGMAVTNVFDGTKTLGEANDPTAFKLKGISHQNDIGFLTLLEALRYAPPVGEYLKSPNYPIWVIGSSNHYTIMFALDRRVGQLTDNQKKQRAVRTAFDEMDPENNGFIPVASLGALISKLGAGAIPPGTTEAELKRRLDPDNLGIILQERVNTVLDQIVKLRALTLAQASVSNTPFSCTACTYNNAASAQTCEICGTPRPPAVAPPPPKPEQVEIQNFKLYHFNGIEIPGKSFCECHTVSVSVVEGGLPPQIQGDVISEGQGLKEILLTRWPSCILEIDGVAKIS